MNDLPQMWELSALMQLEQQAQDAEELRTAILLEAGAVHLADRLRGATGWPVEVRTIDGAAVAGTVELVGSDAVVLADGSDCCLLPLHALAAASLPAEPAVLPARGVERIGWHALLRRLVDRSVAASLVGGFSLAGPLRAVGSDHVAVDAGQGPNYIPVAALLRLRWRADGAG